MVSLKKESVDKVSLEKEVPYKVSLIKDERADTKNVSITKSENNNSEKKENIQPECRNKMEIKEYEFNISAVPLKKSSTVKRAGKRVLLVVAALFVFCSAVTIWKKIDEEKDEPVQAGNHIAEETKKVRITDSDNISAEKKSVNPESTVSENTSSEKTSEEKKSSLKKLSDTIDSGKEKLKSQIEKLPGYSKYYSLISNLSEKVNENSENTLSYRNYFLYDINNDGIYELVIHLGAGEADSKLMFYTLDENGELKALDELSGSHMVISEKDGKLYTNYGMMGIQVVDEIKMLKSGDHWDIVKEKIYEDSNLIDYEAFGKVVEYADISDCSAVEKMCPDENLLILPSVEVSLQPDMSGNNGIFRLYVNGDFSSVMVACIDLNSYDDLKIGDLNIFDDKKIFKKEEINEFLVINMNVASPEKNGVLVIPFNDFGAFGKAKLCEIPLESSDPVDLSTPVVSECNAKGQINCHGGIVAGFTTDYVVNGGAAGKVRNSLGNRWHITAKRQYYSYDVLWYELWDSDDGDYYGWVDANYIDFY